MRTSRRSSSSNIPQGSILLNGELVSEETLQKRAEPQEKKKKGKSLWVQLATQHYLWIWLLGAGGVGALVSPHWKAIDPYVPWVNELIHGNVTDQRDVEYQEFKFQQSRDELTKLRALCTYTSPNLDGCRKLQSSEPMLDEMKGRLDKLETAWQRVAYGTPQDSACQQDGTVSFSLADEYITEEKQAIYFVRHANLESVAAQKSLWEQLDNLSPQEQATAARMHGLSIWPASCGVLTHR